MKKKRSSLKPQDSVQMCREILVYFSKKCLVNIDFSDLSQSKTLQELKFVFQQNLVKFLLKFSNPASQEHEQGKNLWKLGLRFLNLQIGNAIEKDMLDVVGEGSEWVEPPLKKSRSRSKVTENLESLDFGQKYALVQKGVEGNFFFTTAVSRLIDDYNVDTNAAKIKIEPTQPIKQDQVANLASVAGTGPKMAPGRQVRKGFRIYAAEFPEYGAFHSFAPSVDLARSNLSRIDSISIRYPGRKVIIEDGLQVATFPVSVYNGDLDSSFPQLISLPTEEELDNLNEAPEVVESEFLKEFGIDLDNLLEKEDMDICELDDSALFERNVQLIKKLISFQDDRIAKGAGKVSSAELNTATSLKANLSKIVSSFKPKDLVSVDQIRKAMQYVRKTEKAFRGGLSQQAPFVFPCNTAGNGVIPAGSGTVPLALLKDGR